MLFPVFAEKQYATGCLCIFPAICKTYAYLYYSWIQSVVVLLFIIIMAINIFWLLHIYLKNFEASQTFLIHQHQIKSIKKIIKWNKGYMFCSWFKIKPENAIWPAILKLKESQVDLIKWDYLLPSRSDTVGIIKWLP